MFNEKETSIISKELSNGNWGTYYKSESLPEERWDPFRTIIREDGTKIGHQTIISMFRQKRPFEFPFQQTAKSNSYEDSFCQLISSKIPSIVISKDENIARNPFSKRPEYENLKNSKVFTSLNLYSPFIRVFLNQYKAKFRKNNYVRGISLIHTFTKHYVKIEDVPEEEMVLYLKNIILSINECRKSLKINNSGYFDIVHFYNIGPSSGASIPHLHSQTLMQFGKKGHGWKFESFLKAYKFHKKKTSDPSYCLACNHSKSLEIDHLGQKMFLNERKIWEDDYWMIFLAFAPEKDSQLRLIPKRHVSILWQLKREEIRSLAKALLVANKILSRYIHNKGKELFLRQDRNLVFRQYFSQFHMLIDIIPIQQVGGGEILDDYKLSHIFPEMIAQEMKDFIV